MIYLDSAATTKIAPEVLEVMMPYLTNEYGNAGALYGLGRSAAAAIQSAREQVSTLFGCTPDHVIFTSGGSESNSTVFSGLRQRLKDAGKTHLIVSAIEHDSVLRAAKMLTKDGFYITYIKPGSDGRIAPKAIEAAIRENTGLVSVMFVNNETGVINDINEIGRICRQSAILFHTDCVQAAGQYPLTVHKNDVDFASVSSHKIYGPKGVGALFVREKDLLPLVCGGADQEFGLRGGTENVAGIVGFGKAAEMAVTNMHDDMIGVSMMKQKFYTTLMETLCELGCDTEYLHVNGHPVIDPGKTLNLRLDGVDAQTLLLMLDSKGVCISAGSACRSHEAEPSHVLIAMGLTPDEARSSVRISFSKYNTTDEVTGAAKILAACIFALQSCNAVAES